MNCRIRIYTGLTHGPAGDHVDASGTKREQLQQYLAQHFTGATMYDHAGIWRNASGRTISEAGITVEILAGYPRLWDAEHYGKLAATRIRDMFEQDAVMLTIEELPIMGVI